MAEKLYNVFEAVWGRLFGNYETVVDFSGLISENDKKTSRLTAALGYLCFIIPMVFHEDKQFARFHCNQSFLNLILSTVVALVWSFIPYIGVYLVLLQEIICVLIALRGIAQSFSGKAKSIPFIGWITFIAYRYPEQA